ncbi:MAG TPA: FAD-dependent monooxygenase [Longimicrobiales bacterium]
MTATGHAAVIAGGGPTGLMLAAELALAGVDVAVVERRPTQDMPRAGARGLHARTIEVLDMRGVADRFLAAGQTAQVISFAGERLDISDFPTRHPYGLALLQKHFERILAEWVASLPVTQYRGVELTGFAQDDDGVDVALSDGRTLRARWLVGCDGGRSLVRKRAGIDFVGWDPTTSWLLVEAQTTETPRWGFHEDDVGRHAIGPTEDGGAGIVLVERELRSGEATLDDVRAALAATYGTDFGIHSPTWISRFTDATRQAATYRAGRVFLAGDAAHIHPPLGGQGLNIGVQDAVNLGWKLALVDAGVAPDALLDTYEAERHPVAARALRMTMALTALGRSDARTKALGEVVAELVRTDAGRRHVAAEQAGLGVRYDFGDGGAGHPLLGRRMPDLDLGTAFGPVRVYALLRDARPVLISFGGPALRIDGWADRVPSIAATYDGAWELPEIGAVSAPAAVLVRPDGYVAWVGDGTSAGLEEALARWFGPSIPL